MGNILDPNKRIENLQKLAAISGHRGASRLVEIAALSSNPQFCEKLENFFGKVAAINLAEIHPFLPGPDPSEVGTGDVILGFLQDGSPVMLPLGLLSQNLYIVGTTGTGKTWDSIYICKQIISQGIRVWIFDRENHMYKYFSEEIRNGKVMVLSYKNFKRNPLEPVLGEERKETVNRTSSTWRGALYLRDGSANLLSQKLNELYERAGDKANYPSVHTLRRYLSKMTFRNFNSRQAQYWETLINRTTLLADQMADTYDCSQGFDIRDMLNCSIIFNLQGLSDFLHQFFISDLLGYVIFDKQRNISDKLTNLFVIDEASLLLAQDADRSDLSEPFICQAARAVRKLGLGLILANQTAFDAPSSIIGNMNTRIVMRVINGRDIQTLGMAMSLSKDQMDYLTQMPLRAAVVHSLAYPEPFLMFIPELDFDQTMGEEELRQLSLRAALMFGSVPEIIEEDNIGTRDDIPASLDSAVTKDETDYLIAIAQNPFISVTQLDRYCNMSLYKGHQLRDKLGAREYINAHKIKTGKKGNPFTILEITETGWQYLESIKAKVEKHKGVGGFIHCYWQSKIKEWYEQKYKGCKAIIEDKNSGKAVDVGVHFKDKKTAVEVMIHGEGKEINNITKDLENYDLVMCCAEDWDALNSLKEKVEKEVEADKRNRVWFKVLGEFLVNDNIASPSQSSGSAIDDK